MEDKKALNDEELDKVVGGFSERSNIENQVIYIISEQLEIDRNSIHLNSKLTFDLGVDTQDMMDILRELENTFGVNFSESRISALITVNDIVHEINRIMSNF